MDLIDKYLKRLQPVTKTLSNAVQYLPNGKVLQTGLQSKPVQQFAGSVANSAINTVKQGVPAVMNLKFAQTPRIIQSAMQGKKYQTPTFGQQLGDVANAGKLALSAYGLPKVGIQGLAASGVLGGAINKATGGSFAQGAGQGVASAPMLGGISSFSNPMIAKYSAKLGARITNPVGKTIADRVALGALNVPEGAVINASLGQNALTPHGMALDFASGALLGGPLSSRVTKMNVAKHRTGVAPGDAQAIKDTILKIQKNLGNADYAVRLKQRDENFLRQMAGDYLDKTWSKKAPLQDVAQELMNRVRVDEGASEFALPSMGIAGKQQTAQKYANGINLERLETTKKSRQAIRQEVEKLKPELDQIKGKPLTRQEISEATADAEVLKKVVTREETERVAASLNRLRQAVAAGGEGKGLTPDFVENLKVLSSQATDWGRRGNALAIDAKSLEFGAKEKVINQLVKLGHKTEDLVKAAEGLDWNDGRQVAEYYRKFVKPTFGDMASEYRYMNLLSSPRTHIVNAFSNAIQATAVRPATKLASGIIDPVASALTGGKREAYLAEVPLYYRGMFASLPEAFNKVRDVFSGKQAISNLDLDRMPSNTILSKGNIVTKSLEATDQFFKTIIAAGEKEGLNYRFTKQGKSLDTVGQTADDLATYSTFRQGLKPKGQGAVLNWVDHGTQAIQGLRKVPGVSWFIPFLQTPMNILKQGVEYSPAGFTTMIGATNQREQMAKALVGSTVFMGAGYLALQDKITWAAPKDQTQRENFYASGLQPYSVKIGDKWVSYSKLGPLAYPLALAAGMKYAFEDDPASAARSFDESALAALTGTVGFFADQSYMQGIGDLVKNIEGQQGFNLSKIVSNVATQYVPLSSMQRWVANIIDPIYRKSDTIGGNIAKGIPFLSDDQDYYENPLGEPSQRQMPGLNAFSPVSVTQEVPEFQDLYQMRDEELRQNAILNREEKDLEKQLKEPAKANMAEASEGGLSTTDQLSTKRSELEEELARKRIKLRGGTETVGGKIIYKDNNDEVTSLDLGKFDTPATGIERLVQEKEKLSTARKVFGIEGLDDQQKDQIFEKLGVKKEDAEYDYLATQDSDIKAQYLYEQLQSVDRQQALATLYAGRRESITGERYVNDGTLDYLEEIGFISDAEAKSLKKVKLDNKGGMKAGTSGGGGRKARTISIPKARRISTTSSSSHIKRVTDYKLTPVKLKNTKLSKKKLKKVSLKRSS